MITKRWIAPALIGGMVLFTAVVYSRLPAELPTHWNIRGEVDGWSSRPVGALMLPVIALALWLLLPLLRRLDPRAEHYERFDATFWLLVNVLVMFMAAMHVIVLGSGLGWPVDVSRAVLVLVGLLFMALGNYLPRLRSNWWMGIRTPWTLESEEVWRSTHRLAGTTFVLGGVATVIAAVLPTPAAFPLAFVAMSVAALVPVVYSYVAYRRGGT
jgi:uncharacterized membrane protein